MKARTDLFWRYKAWNGATYFWPRHWVGAIIMAATSILALGLSLLAAGALAVMHHPRLEWLGLIVGFAVYASFDQIARHYSRD